MNGKTAILIVNGFDRRGVFGSYDAAEARRYPWISLCLRQIERFSAPAHYQVLVYDTTLLPEHEEILQAYSRLQVFRERKNKSHQKGLDFLVTQVGEEYEYVLTLDSDAFPVRAGWLEELMNRLAAGAAVAGVWRDEMAPKIQPFVHVSCLCIRRSDLLDLRSRGISFAQNIAQDVGQNVTNAMTQAGRLIAPLRRSNAWNAHFLLGGLYGDLIYHQGAGSRRARFWTSTDLDSDERTRIALRDAAFSDLDGLIAALRGAGPRPPGWEA